MPADFRPRVQLSEWFLEQQTFDPHFSKYVLFTDEAYFTRDGVFNYHNNHNWQQNNPHVIHPGSHQQRFNLNVWAGIVGDHLIGPYLMPSLLTGPNYTLFLRNVLPDLLDNVPIATRRRMWFQQDGAPPHYSREAREFLNERFPNRWIGRGGPVAWPPRSPDLTPLDFFFWGTMKDLVYATPVETEEDLVGRIVDAAAVTAEMPGVFNNVRRSLAARFTRCVQVNGDHFEHLL